MKVEAPPGTASTPDPFGTVHSTTKSFVPSTTNARMTDRKWELAMGVG